MTVYMMAVRLFKTLWYSEAHQGKTLLRLGFDIHYAWCCWQLVRLSSY